MIAQNSHLPMPYIDLPTTALDNQKKVEKELLIYIPTIYTLYTIH